MSWKKIKDKIELAGAFAEIYGFERTITADKPIMTSFHLTQRKSVYEWFTEGFDTADLKDAKTLLADLT